MSGTSRQTTTKDSRVSFYQNPTTGSLSREEGSEQEMKSRQPLGAAGASTDTSPLGAPATFEDYPDLSRNSSAGSGVFRKEKVKRSLKEKKEENTFTLSPFEKFRRYRTVPCKFILNVLIFVLLNVVIFQFQLARAVMDHGHERELAEIFLPNEYIREDYSFQMSNYLPTYRFRTISSLKSHLNQSVASYYSLVKQSLGYTSFYATKGVQVDPGLQRVSSGGRSSNSRSAAASSSNDGEGQVEYEVLKPLLTIVTRPDSVRFHSDLEVRPALTAFQFHVGEKGPLQIIDAKEQEFSGSQGSEYANQSVSTAPVRKVTRKLCVPRQEAFSDAVFLICNHQMSVDPTALDFYRDKTTEITLDLKFRTVRIDDPVTGDTAEYDWTVHQTYDMSISGICTLTIRVKGTLQRSVTKLSWGVAVNLLLFFFAVWDAYLRVRIIFRFKKFQRTHAYLFLEKGDGFGVATTTEEAWISLDLPTEQKEKALAKRERKASRAAKRRLSRVGQRQNSPSLSPNASPRTSPMTSPRPQDRSSEFTPTSPVNSQESPITSPPQATMSQVTVEMTHPAMKLQHDSSDDDDTDDTDSDNSFTSLEGDRDEMGTTFASLGPSLSNFAQTQNGQSGAFASGDHTPSGSPRGGSLASPLLNPASPHKTRRRRKEKKVNKNTLGAEWIAWAILGDVFTIAATTMNLVEILAVQETEGFVLIRNVCLGTAALLNTTLFISYFRHVPKFYFLIEAMGHALPKIGLFGVSVLPLFFGYSFFGLVVFGPYATTFRTWEYTIVTLFALVGGDSPLFTFLVSSNVHGVAMQLLARFYVSSFVVLLLVCCLNITLAIVQDSYYHIKRRLRILGVDDPTLSAASGGADGSYAFLPREEGEFSVNSPNGGAGVGTSGGVEPSANFFTNKDRLMNGEIRNGPKILRKEDVERAINQLMYMLETIPNDQDDEEELGFDNQ